MDQSNRNIQLGQKSVYAEQGDVYVTYAGERRIPHALTPPPFLTEIFLGRQDDLQLIHDKLFASGSNLLLVNGEGGIGKTTIASKYYHTYQHEYIHVAWVLSEKSIANALLLLAVPLNLQFDERMNTDERIGLLLAALMNLEKPCLLVIDNANELSDLEANYQRLRRSSNFHLLLTTRITHFERAEACAINGLPQDDALALFKKYYRVLDDGEEALFFQIREAVGGNTLVLELLAKNLVGQNRLKPRYSLSNLLADLQSQGLLQLSHSQAVGTDYQSKGAMRRETPEAIISAMYDLSGLPAQEGALLSVFAVLPAESIPFARLETLLPGLPELDTCLLSLAQKGWIEYNEATISFKCSPVVQEVTRQKNPGLREDCTMLVNTLIEKLGYDGRHMTGSSYDEAHLYARYAEAVMKTFLMKPDDNLLALSERTGNYHRITGNLERSLFFFEHLTQVCKTLLEGAPDDPALKNNLATSYSELGTTHKAMGNLQQALTCFEQSNRLGKELFDTYPQDALCKGFLAISCQYLGDTHKAMGNLEQALTFFEQSNQLEKALSDAAPQDVGFKHELAISCQHLGITHKALGNLKEALDFFEQYHRLEKELVDVYPQNVEFKYNLAASYQFLGSTHTALGNLKEALDFSGQYHRLEKELADAYPQNVEFKDSLAISCQHLGITHTALGNLKEALDFFEQYHQLEKELADVYPRNVGFKNGLALSCQCLGGTHQALGNLKEALDFFEQYHQLEKELADVYPRNVEFKNNLALSYQWLGWFYEDKLQDLNQGQAYYRLSKSLLLELVSSFPGYVQFKQSLDWVTSRLPDEADE
ncbi:MAG TPA: tetratricopeptide repeat protein [Nitrosomonas sp.]|nr:tetratricopeptide repeat protein [Nitrosomonas sp.]HMY61367.1 tetratricopeptide repeat protein [Nitrosomonas sp.]HMY90098.1 tetratricopeptide repeat protein [Nitrosomonas sp.]HNH68149.1 tetratricopeptide repeat protein [Nitrosomonas sp.]HNJ91790.1 tetratricopeptide repeat protein [Nitrosomonas sp.]